MSSASVSSFLRGPKEHIMIVYDLGQCLRVDELVAQFVRRMLSAVLGGAGQRISKHCVCF